MKYITEELVSCLGELQRELILAVPDPFGRFCLRRGHILLRIVCCHLLVEKAGIDAWLDFFKRADQSGRGHSYCESGTILAQQD